MLLLNSGFLSPAIGCGMMLTRIPSYHTPAVLRDIMHSYGCPNLFADKAAVQIIEGNEDLARAFSENADAGLPLKLNFRTVYLPTGMHLAVDVRRQAAYFLAEPEHTTTLTNYHRDAMPHVARVLKLTIGGTPGRLTGVGWQNLYDVTTDVSFRRNCPPLKRIEITAGTQTVRWREPVLEVGINLLNFSSAPAIRKAISDEIRPERRGSNVAAPMSLAQR
jgi:hypothetical protein